MVVDSQDTEITLGTAKLLGLFFGLVIICAVFFALGYTLGRKSDVGIASASTTTLPATTTGPKPAGSASTQPTPAMTFYKAVEQKDANAQLTPATASTEAAAPATANQATAASSTAQSQTSQSATAPDPMSPVPTVGYFVQVAAVSKQDDAEALVSALKKKQYPAFVAAGTSTDKLFRVQVGPFSDIKDAEGMRSRLINDGYSPILKK
jgi:cell division septation protein DedD